MKIVTIIAKVTLNELSAKEWAQFLRSYGMDVEMKPRKAKKRK